MKRKELITRKRLLFSLVAVATIATSFVLYATMHTTTPPTSVGTSIPAFSTNTDGGDVQQAFSRTGPRTPSGSFTPNQLADNSRARHGSDGTGFATVLDDASPPIELADNSDVDSNPATNTDAVQVVHGSDGKGSDTSPDDFTPILLANNDFPKHDYDLQAIETQGVVGHGPGPKNNSAASGTSLGSVNEPPSHVPEPASMLLLGTALVGVAVFARKLKKSEAEKI